MNTRHMFEWDEQKNLQNQISHNVSFEQACNAFNDPNHIIIDDEWHSIDEPRYHIIGFDGVGVATIRFTMREGTIRIFGAGYWRKGKKIYERGNEK